jgi:exosortase C (VPDSG-CTERM-specific)
MPAPTASLGGNLMSQRNFVLATLALVLCFAWPLYQLAHLAWGSNLLSYILLVPFVSGYLVWIKRDQLRPSAPDYPLTFGFALVGAALVAWFWISRPTGKPGAEQDALTPLILSFVCFVVGLGGYCFGRPTMRTLAFPAAFLVFMTPPTSFVIDTTEPLLQHGSADVAYAFLRMSGTPVLRNGLLFMLPGINLEVAPECSGIHSSLVLLLTSLVASHLFLRTRWKQAVLVLAVIPLALLRNGFRIWVIGELCVRVGPEMINSAIHRRGGPLFFVISLVPLALLLYFLAKSDRSVRATTHRTS